MKQKWFKIRNRFNGKLIFSWKCESLSICIGIGIAIGKDLSYANLSSADLSSANLSYANLSSADLSSANLRYANLRSANLISADLSSADLSSANLRYANLRSANLSSADLSSADLSSADLSYANLSYANLSSADLDFSCNPLWCGGLNIKKDRKQIIQDVYHTASNMKDYLSKNKDEKLQKIFELSEELQDEFHKISETGRL